MNKRNDSRVAAGGEPIMRAKLEGVALKNIARKK